MAALPDAQVPELVELSSVGSAWLEGMLEEETRVWREQLAWDFTSSADLVRRFVDVRALNGYALVVNGEAAGYTYCVSEEHKGLVGDLYVREEFRSPDNDASLLGAVVHKLMRTPYVRRIESQLMLLEQRSLPMGRLARTFDRQFMMFDLRDLPRLRSRPVRASVLFDLWTERRQEETAQLIAAAYRGHIDSDINDQYRSSGGARRFLYNIVQYPGCGNFFPPGAWVAVQRDTGRLCGVCLSSLVADEVGHITQVCVAPAMRGTGLGYQLMRHSLESLAQMGATRVSLTVTSANRGAVELYERMGFRTVRQFQAMVWEGF